MVRSLWTAATGMVAQQTNIDTIANNLANVNTNAYKTQVNEFKSLLYQTIQTKTTSANGEEKPTSAQVGLGTRNASINSVFKQGSLLASDSDSAFAIDGRGFFAVKGTDGNTYYTRNGNFVWSLGSNNTLMLTTTDGLPVKDTNGRDIAVNGTYDVSQITIDDEGNLYYPDDKNNPQPINIKMAVFQFNNPGGLERLADSLYAQTAASGQPLSEANNATLTKSQLIQGYLEGSNVQVVDEMVNMIVAQRAYELNSKAITASDEMLQQANNLRR